jgi:hypothetical protein
MAALWSALIAMVEIVATSKEMVKFLKGAYYVLLRI